MAFPCLVITLAGACSDAPIPPAPTPPAATPAVSDADMAHKIVNPFAEGVPSAPKAIAADAQRAVHVLGALTSGQIVDVVRSHNAHVTNCARASSGAGERATGLVVVKLTIGADGRVKQAQAIESSLGRADVEDCLVGALKTWTFPEPKAGGMAVVTYPLRIE